MNLGTGSKTQEELRYSPGMLSASKVEAFQKVLCEQFKKIQELGKIDEDRSISFNSVNKSLEANALPSIDESAEPDLNNQKIKTNLNDLHLDPKFLDKLQSIATKYPDIQNALINFPGAISHLKPDDLKNLADSTPEDFAKSIRQMAKDTKFNFKKQDHFNNKGCDSTKNKDKKSNKIKGSIGYKAGSVIQDDEMIKPVDKDTFGNEIKVSY